VVRGGTLNVLKAAGAAGIERMVYVSSTVALGGSRERVVRTETSRSPLPRGPYAYARAKLQAEEFCREYCDRISITIVNPGEVYGPNDINLITAGKLIRFPTPNPLMVIEGGTSAPYVGPVSRA